MFRFLLIHLCEWVLCTGVMLQLCIEVYFWTSLQFVRKFTLFWPSPVQLIHEKSYTATGWGGGGGEEMPSQTFLELRILNLTLKNESYDFGPSREENLRWVCEKFVVLKKSLENFHSAVFEVADSETDARKCSVMWVLG